MRALAVAAGLVLLLLAGVFALLFVRGGTDMPAGRIEGAAIPTTVLESRASAQRSAAERERPGEVRGEAPREEQGGAQGSGQILFGDLHVHTTYSIDAFLYSLPLFSSEGAHPPADACDFARYCSALDFFSINDHAEGLTPERWQGTVESIRECNARAGDPRAPDLVAFVGWEWTQVGATPETHFGHKNVVVRGLSDAEVPARPIAYLSPTDLARAPDPTLLRLGEGAASFLGKPYADFLWWIRRMTEMPSCDPDADSRTLPADCRESAETPAQLFAKLRQWGGDALVIPHGLAWGIHAPPGARLDHQLNPAQHDPKYQRLLEVFSGHGNSEEYRPWLDRPQAGSDAEVCPAPAPDFLPCCWRAGEIARERCGDIPEAACAARVEQAKRFSLAAGVAPHHVFPDAPMEAWLDCDQCRDCFKPAMRGRAGQSAQYSLAISHFPEAAEGDAAQPLRFDWGFIASSDNHRARSATGYKQFARLATTDARGVRDAGTEARLRSFLGGDAPEDPAIPQEVAFNPRSFEALLDRERTASFMYPGGLVAVHAAARHRDAIFDALQRKQVYGTSGPRILLWFDLLNGVRDFSAGVVSMGGEARVREAPRFRARAVGALVQKPGCPTHAHAGLPADRLAALCLGECHHPGDTRHLISRIEVVRVLPQQRVGDPLRIEDPWRVFECAPDPEGCTVEFSDEAFLEDSDPAMRDAGYEAVYEAVYYVRALQAPTPAINGAPLQTRFDADGNAIDTEPCYGDHRTPDSDLCLAPASERAWSSPISVREANAASRAASSLPAEDALWAEDYGEAP